MATPIPVNRCVFDAAEIMRATAALFSGNPELRTHGVSIDTRNLQPGSLFVALRGARDGHDFIDAAARAQAGAAIVERGRRHYALPCFEVNDTLGALGALASLHLERVRALRSLPVVAIGGAAGKTTTKELAAAVTRALFGEILATPGNLNNLIGVPMTLLTLGESHRAVVLECGTNRRGEIARLGDIVKPDIALVLNVDVEHTEGLGSLDGVADEEAALFSHAHCAIVSISEELLTARIPAGLRTVTFGSEKTAEVRLVGRRIMAPARQQIELELAPWIVEMAAPHHLEATLNLLGGPIAENAAAAVAAAVASWGRPLGREQLATLADALGSVQKVPGRLCARELNGMVIIDDTYNANPRSVRAALTAARETADGLGARLVVALGDMLELGKLSPIMHAAAVGDVIAARPEQFIAVGQEFVRALKYLRDSVDIRPKIHVASDSGEAAAILREIVHHGDVLLIKGSRAIGMERLIDSLAAA
jgi:UDP-N-acetylmuramoyl-tripeptide--D-alanyl-D-alanine ligase